MERCNKFIHSAQVQLRRDKSQKEQRSEGIKLRGCSKLREARKLRRRDAQRNLAKARNTVFVQCFVVPAGQKDDFWKLNVGKICTTLWQESDSEFKIQNR